MRLKDHLNKLEYFMIIAEAGSLKMASQKALVGQPQLTKIIQQLESTLGKQLITRSVKGVNLTKEGHVLLGYTKKIFKEINEAEFIVKSGKQNIKGSVNIGTYDSIARYFFPDFLKYLKTNMPDIKISLETGRSKEVLKKVSQSKIDVAIVVAPERVSKSLVSKKIYTDSFGLYRSSNMSNEFSDNLIYFPFPMNDTEKAMAKFGFKESMSCDNLETVKSLTEQALGVGLIPHRVAKESVLAKKMVEFRHPKIKGNSFDYHDVIMSYSKDESNDAKNYIVAEVERFLDIWYNN